MICESLVEDDRILQRGNQQPEKDCLSVSSDGEDINSNVGRWEGLGQQLVQWMSGPEGVESSECVVDNKIERR